MSLGAEDRLLAALRRRLRRRGEDLLGDDAALLPDPRRWAVSVDHQVAGVHFPPGLDPAVVGRRLLAVGLSDLAASGARPAYAFLALALPPEFSARRLFDGLLAACRRHGVILAGGDLARSPRLVASLTVMGKRPGGGRWLRRGDARPGDRLWVGGTLGESAAGRLLLAAGARLTGRRVDLEAVAGLAPGLGPAARRAVRRHLSPRPQLELGLVLGRRRRAAAIDVSDGLALDLHRLCRASGVGAVVEAEALPTAPRHRELSSALAQDPLDLAVAGGEDYVLLFCLPAGARPPDGFGCRAIGRVRGGSAVELEGSGGRRPLPPDGWDHLELALR